MITTTELAFTPATQLRKLVAEKQVSPVELAENSLRRIDELDPTLNAFLAVTPDLAMDAARKAEDAVLRGDPLGPLHGIPISIKDLVDVKGVRTSMGSLTTEGHVADEDAIVVQRIKAAGAVIVGKTNTPEYGQSATTDNALGDDCCNPWDPQRVPGGSSGGASSSVAAGITPFAQGSDGGGSIRIPASFCGNFGIKGTAGRVPSPVSGPMARLPTFSFSVVSPVARTVRDAVMLLEVMAGPHPDDLLSMQFDAPEFTPELGRGIEGLRIAWSPDLGSAPVDPEVLAATERAASSFEGMGATVEPAPIKVEVEDLFRTFTIIHHPALYLRYGRIYEEKGELMMPWLRSKFALGKAVTGPEFLKAMSQMELWRSQVAALFETYDLLLTPTLSVPAFPCGQWPTEIAGRELDALSVSEHAGYYHFTYPFNMSGSPAASVPCGFSSAGLPIGLQIVGRKGDEATVLRASAAFEEAHPWAQKRPPVGG